jgi:hypothetical protein
MFGSEVLEVGAGVTLFFLIVSLICSAIREAIETVMRSRSRDLEHGIRVLLDDPDGTQLTRALFNHGQIFSLFSGEYRPDKLHLSRFSKVLQMPRDERKHLPSYIPAGQFASALMDIVMRGRGDWPYPVDSQALTLDALRERAAFLPSGRVQRAVLAAIDGAGGDIDRAKKNLADWYDGSMDRVSGWYKRRTQKFLFAIGLAVAALMNLDALTVTNRLVNDKAVRSAFVAEAERVQAAGLTPTPTTADGKVDAGQALEDAQARVQALRGGLESLGAPIGWANGWPAPQSCPARAADGSCPAGERITAGGIFVMVIGWLVTAGAVTFGAPFWFDILNKIMVIRSTVKPKEKSQEEASEDRQRKPPDSVAPVNVAVAPAPPAPAPPAAALTPATVALLDYTRDDELFEPEEWAPNYVNPEEIRL